ncbi:MAG: DUF47 family protein [Pirellulales bacterium]
MFSFIPSNTKFYDHFNRIAEILVKAAERFQEFTSMPEHVDRCVAEIKSLEHEADEETHDCLALLYQSFITPLERGEIRRLTESLDDVIDLVDDACRRIMMYDLRVLLPEVRDQARILVEASHLIRQAVAELPHIQKKRDAIMQSCVEVRRLENEGDQVNHEVLGRLFQSGFEALDVMKWKDVVEYVESAIDRCQDVSNVLENIVLENT